MWRWTTRDCRYHYWLISQTGCQYDAVFSVDNFPVVFRARDIRQVVRRRASPPGGRTVGAAHDYCQHKPPAPVVDLVTGKCKRGIVSRPVFTSTPTFDLTVVCTSWVKVPPPGASTQVVLPPATVANAVTAIGTSTPFVATPAPVMEHRGCRPRSFRHFGCRSRPSYFRRSDCCSRLPRPLCRGEQRRTRRALFAQPCSGGMLAGCSFIVSVQRTVRSVCHRFHQDSSIGLHEGAV